jgi:hypothetical protein
MERSLQEIQGVVDVPFKLFPAELENFTWLIHKYAYIYAYYKPENRPVNLEKVKNHEKMCPMELNCYYYV